VDRHAATSCADALSLSWRRPPASIPCAHLAEFDILLRSCVLVSCRRPRDPTSLMPRRKSDWIDLLPHRFSPALLIPASPLTYDNARQLQNGLKTRSRRPRPRGAKRFITDPLPTWASRRSDSSTSRLMVVRPPGVGDRGLQTLLDVDSDPLARKLQIGKCGRAFCPDRCATRLSFCGLHSPKHPGDCLASLSGRLRRLWFCSIAQSASLLWLLVARMAREGTGRREPAELVNPPFLVDPILGTCSGRCRRPNTKPTNCAGWSSAAPDLDPSRTADARAGTLLLEHELDERAFPD